MVCRELDAEVFDDVAMSFWKAWETSQVTRSHNNNINRELASFPDSALNFRLLA